MELEVGGGGVNVWGGRLAGLGFCSSAGTALLFGGIDRTRAKPLTSCLLLPVFGDTREQNFLSLGRAPEDEADAKSIPRPPDTRGLNNTQPFTMTAPVHQLCLGDGCCDWLKQSESDLDQSQHCGLTTRAVLPLQQGLGGGGVVGLPRCLQRR